MHAPQYSFGRAPAQRIEEIEMSLRCEYHKVRLPFTLSFYDLVYHIALSYYDVIGPSGPVGRRNNRCGFRLADVNEPEFSRGTIKAERQK